MEEIKKARCTDGTRDNQIINSMLELSKKYASVGFLTLSLLLPRCLEAQSDYAVTFKGDTLNGELKIMSYDRVDRVQVIQQGQKQNFTALQIKSISKAGLMYEPIRYENSIRFMQVIKSGFLSLYNFSIQNNAGQYLSKKDGSGMEVPNLSFKRSLSNFLKECPDVVKRLDKGEFKKSDLERIVDLYNGCLKGNPDAVASAKPSETSNEKIQAVEKLEAKVQQQNFDAKKDATDLLKDIHQKIAKNENVPNYLLEGLKSYLSSIPAVSQELETLINSLKK